MRFLAIILLSLIYSCVGSTPPPPYEGKWMELEETNQGYVVNNYPSRWDDGKTQSPNMIIVSNGRISEITFSDDVYWFQIDSVRIKADSSYLLYAEYNYRFRLVDQEKHIVQWTTYYKDGRINSNYLYVDSLYNSFPIIDFDWGQERPIDDEAN